MFKRIINQNKKKAGESVYARVKREMNIDVTDKKKFKVEALPNGYVLTAKTAKAVNELTAAHLATVARPK